MKFTYSWQNILEKFFQLQHVWKKEGWSLAGPHHHNSPWSPTCSSAAPGPKQEECSSDPQITQRKGRKLRIYFSCDYSPLKTNSCQSLKYSSASTQTKDYLVLTGRSCSQLLVISLASGVKSTQMWEHTSLLPVHGQKDHQYTNH